MIDQFSSNGKYMESEKKGQISWKPINILENCLPLPCLLSKWVRSYVFTCLYSVLSSIKAQHFSTPSQRSTPLDTPRQSNLHFYEEQLCNPELPIDFVTTCMTCQTLIKDLAPWDCKLKSVASVGL